MSYNHCIIIALYIVSCILIIDKSVTVISIAHESRFLIIVQENENKKYLIKGNNENTNRNSCENNEDDVKIKELREVEDI